MDETSTPGRGGRVGRDAGRGRESCDRSVEPAGEARAIHLIQSIIQASNAADDVSQAISDALQITCESMGWSVGHGLLLRGQQSAPATTDHIWHLEDPQRAEEFRAASEQLGRERRPLILTRALEERRVCIVPDVAVEPDFVRAEVAAEAGLVGGVATPVHVGGVAPAALEFFSPSVMEPTAALEALVSAIAGQLSFVIERWMLEEGVSNSLWLVQRRVGRELHDSVCQDLVGAAFLARGLSDELKREESPHADAASDVVDALSKALTRTRAISRGLSPIECDADELPSALRDLVRGVSERFEIPCSLDSPEELLLDDREQANQLYFIAQEGLMNAVKHSQASRIHVQLVNEPDQVVTRIRDDGVGLDDPQDVADGIGLRVMRYRARQIGARLDVASQPGGGTVMTCVLARKETRNGDGTHDETETYPDR